MKPTSKAGVSNLEAASDTEAGTIACRYLRSPPIESSASSKRQPRPPPATHPAEEAFSFQGISISAVSSSKVSPVRNSRVCSRGILTKEEEIILYNIIQA
jgi:hypothetical protein